MKIKKIIVLPDVPKPLEKLKKLAYNMYFSWAPEVRAFFASIDEECWLRCRQNPVKFLAEVPKEKLHKLAKQESKLKELGRIYDDFQNYLNAPSWYEKKYGKQKKITIAYFCCEFGLDISVPIYSGGLGILAGDHIKTASDLGLPLVGVGLFYRNGYFEQGIDSSGNQIEIYRVNDVYAMPVETVENKDGTQKRFQIELGDEVLHFVVKKLTIGRINILLMDTNVPENPEHLKVITRSLYDGNREIRIQQEFLLGIGGVQVLAELGYGIETYHINEGHSAFLQLERIRMLMENKGTDFEAARVIVRHGTCFTTHTPVPAGNEVFEIPLVEKYLRKRAEKQKMNWEMFLSLGRVNTANQSEQFNLTVFALKLSGYNNGVSQLHGVVSRNMWQDLYPGIPTSEVPIGAITNGVHAQTWTNPELLGLISERHKTFDKSTTLYEKDFFKHALGLDDKKLWTWKNEARKQLVEYTRHHLFKQSSDKDAKFTPSSKVGEMLNEGYLTIGFARRFATYKRGALFLKNIERLKSILTNPERPVQMLIAGKAHPSDKFGKGIIRSIIAIVREHKLENHVLFLPNYDIDMAKYLVAGVDIWLNNPIKPKEASGTSGMKAAMNGSLNLSIADGWWDEAYNDEIGWVLDSLVDTQNPNLLDRLEAKRFYDQLEYHISPLFYDARDEQKLPRKWVQMMKQSIHQVGSGFNSVRMLQDYVDEMYQPALKSFQALQKNNYTAAKELNQWKAKLFQEWHNVEILAVEGTENSILREENIKIQVQVRLGHLAPEDVCVQAYFGNVALNDTDTEIEDGSTQALEYVGKKGDTHTFQTEIPLEKGGPFAYTARVVPNHKYLINSLDLGLIHWYE